MLAISVAFFELTTYWQYMENSSEMVRNTSENRLINSVLMDRFRFSG